jgi:NitT/TauT family transport system substrate-binding protein
MQAGIWSRALGLALGLTFALAARQANAAELIAVNVGTAQTVTDAPLFIAHKKKFFEEEGLAVNMMPFASAANMVAPLGAGQLDVGAGSASAGLYNAVARGIRIKIVADKSSSPPGYGTTKIMVRKDLVDSGRYKSPKDLKGMRFAMNGPGVSNTSTLNTLLTSAGLTYGDVSTVNLSFPDHLLALTNKSVDASASAEPIATAAVKAGAAVVILRDDEIDPGHQLANILYSQTFAERTDVAMKFMRAYLRAVRFYNRALKDGKLGGETADEVIAILTEYSNIKNPDLLREITPNGCDPDGKINVASLNKDLAFYASQGLIEGKVDMNSIVDTRFIDAAVKSLGPH